MGFDGNRRGIRQPKGRPGWVRSTIAGSVWFLVMALIVRGFIGDVFEVHTSSMEPTVVGRAGGGDRIFLARLPYLVGDPERFDVVLFRYPNNVSTSYMKRVVGLGDEQILIHGGELFVAPPGFGGTLEEGLASGDVTVLRKPEPTRDALLKAFPIPFPQGRDPFEPSRLWHVFRSETGDRSQWTVRDGRAHLHGVGMIRTRAALVDDLPDPVAGTLLMRGRHAVGDLSVRMRFRVDGPAADVRFVIHDPLARKAVEARLRCTAEGDRVRLTVGDHVVAEAETAVPRGTWLTMRFDSVDDRAVLHVADRIVASGDFGHAPLDGPADPAEGGVSFGGSGTIAFEAPRLFRDVYYRGDGRTRFLVPSGHFLFLGDNSAASADARLWRRCAIRVRATGAILEGDADGVSAEGPHAPGANPWTEPDGTRAFVDHRGVVHRFDSPSAYEELGSWSTPYVPRSAVVGRAMAVLTPLDRAGVLR